MAIPYRTVSFAYDAHIFNNSTILQEDFVGVGGVVLHDQAGTTEWQNTQIQLVAAYHKALSGDGTSFLSLGAQIGVAQNAVNATKLLFDSQYDGAIFNPQIPSGETLQDAPIQYLDISTGLAYSYRFDDEYDFYIGIGGFHLNRPNISFLIGGTDFLARKWTAYAGGTMRLSDRIALVLQGVILQQETFQELTIGGLIKYFLLPTYQYNSDDNTGLSVGTFHRFGDAQVWMVQLEYAQWRLGISYDMNLSKLSRASRGLGAIEVSIGYLIGERKGKISCPSF